MSGRWVLYVGLALLIGGVWVGSLAFKDGSGALLGLALAGGLVSLFGLAAVAESTREGAGISWITFARTSPGFNLALQTGPILAAFTILFISVWLRWWWRQLAVLTAGALVALAILTHALTSHAPSSGQPALMVVAQFAHVGAFTVWIGGLAALLVGVRGLPGDRKAQAVRRFSTVAGVALAVVALTGLLRAIDEVGAWSKLLPTLFGQLVLVKVGLLMVLVLLGAANRYRNVPAVSQTLRGLRRVGVAELSVACVLLVASALLTSLAPPAFIRASATAASPRAVTDGRDYGTTVRAHLEVAPGVPGPNRFLLTLVDYDSRKPVAAEKVKLRFSVPSRPEIEESTLELNRAPDGSFRGRGTNLSLDAQWKVVAVVDKGTDSVEVPLTVKIVPPPSPAPGKTGGPTLYTINLSGNRSVQAYIDPGRAGTNQVHFTFFDAKGAELPIGDGVVMKATGSGGEAVTLTVTRYGQGHFIGEGTLAAGQWRFDISAPAGDASQLTASFRETISR